MSDAVERLVNLALFFAQGRTPVTAEQARAEVASYPSGQDEAAFIRMFERDKDDLRRAGLAIRSDETGHYLLDRAATFTTPVDLIAEEAATLRIAGTALAEDPSFPFAAELRLALAKVSAALDRPRPSTSASVVDEQPARQGELVSRLAYAATARKRVEFDYTDSTGATARRVIEPYGLFVHDGRWYLVGRNSEKDSVRTYTVARIVDLSVNESSPRTPDFERAEGFDVSSFIRLPFQYGLPDAEFEAVLCFSAETAWRAGSVTANHGLLEMRGAEVVWRVNSRSVPELLRFVIDNGPGVSLEAPDHAVRAMRSGLDAAARLHG